LTGFERAQDADGEHWLALLNGISDKLPVSRRQWPVVKEFARQLAS
jgi:two-component system, LytTR family, response regulator AlgR